MKSIFESTYRELKRRLISEDSGDESNIPVNWKLSPAVINEYFHGNVYSAAEFESRFKAIFQPADKSNLLDWDAYQIFRNRYGKSSSLRKPFLSYFGRMMLYIAKNRISPNALPFDVQNDMVKEIPEYADFLRKFSFKLNKPALADNASKLIEYRTEIQKAQSERFQAEHDNANAENRVYAARRDYRSAVRNGSSPEELEQARENLQKTREEEEWTRTKNADLPEDLKAAKDNFQKILDDISASDDDVDKAEEEYKEVLAKYPGLKPHDVNMTNEEKIKKSIVDYMSQIKGTELTAYQLAEAIRTSSRRILSALRKLEYEGKAVKSNRKSVIKGGRHYDYWRLPIK